jgi:hypothetical protein
MLALATNFTVFYFAVVLFERMGILCSVTVFLVTALACTIFTSIIENAIWNLLSRGLKACYRRRDARHAVTTPMP